MSANPMTSPGDAIKEKLAERGWTQVDLARVIGRSVSTVNEIIKGKQIVSGEVAVLLSAAMGHEPEFWLGLEANRQLAAVECDPAEVRRRARLFEIAPVKELEKRGWIAATEDAEALESELKSFFEVNSFADEPRISASAKKTGRGGSLNAAQRAWAFRARHMAKAVPAPPYRATSFSALVTKLRRLVAWPEHARKVPAILQEFGIRLVVIEPLPQTKIDGVALWLDEESPVIALSMRFDRIDNFWHVLGHELSHISNNDDPSVDSDLSTEYRPESKDDDVIEERANRESSEMWIPRDELASFISRVSPLYSRDKINQFANRLRTHPGIIVGQLQHRGEVAFRAFRETLVEVRKIVIDETLTDGWGHEVAL
jgi:HTH-type transcriptional regulator/antitoxin HigA